MPAQTLSASPLLDQVHCALNSSPYLMPSDVSVRADEGCVELRGNVASFFQKQMAQELIRRLDGVERVDNHLCVNWL